ncbi:MAG TPA: sensor domain-containing diguanylate cyclase [Nitrospirota bacterium]|nr:sensor domain-containing diguanylate cyclase [Nitrospirota bacterium]
MSKTKKTPKKRKTPIAVGRDFKTLFYRKLTETHLFYEVGKIIASELEPIDLIQKIIATIGKTVIFEDASVYIVKKDLTGLEPILLYNPLLQSKMTEAIYFDNGAPGTIAASGDPLFLDDTALFDSFLHHPDEQTKFGSYIGIPLKNENRIVGVMGFSHGKTSAFRVEDFDLLRTLSHLISAGLEKAELFRKTLELSRVDELTGMLNYRVLIEKLDDEVRRKLRTGRQFSFIMIDIDDFKRINDSYGHLEGSRLIAQMGPLLKAACRTGSTDTCFRYGGEEFSVLLAETDIGEAMAVAERVRKSVEEYPFTVKVAHPQERVTVSLGVATMDVDSMKPVSELIHEADIALYRSKSLGKNRVTCYCDTLTMPGLRADQSSAGPTHTP